MEILDSKPPPEPVPLRTAEKIDAVNRGQDGDLSRLKAIVMEAGDRIARLDPNLRAEVLRDRTAAIKAEAFPSLGPLHEAIVKRAAAAKAAERHWTPEAIRRAALLALEPGSRTALFAVLHRATTGELVEYLHDALDKRNLAEAEAVRLEFSHREDREAHGAAFGAFLSALPIPDVAAVRGKLSRIAGAVLEADNAITGFSRAQTDPMARLAAYRARNVA
jgi:hypothetical protein